ncbi:hypothetical protein M409DRAFT_57122 [Zasmidium cellare ATCC 36951]|uniref:Major facilitator superfamily (MFS) profile domain-containing protein n=1 Tax=Zasmidium cellare ATCC 36951 TaxID=1080233 RepID=A0A6A6CF45_ZASCE|nr:uncharacterized protein M409DRAFT_57122 [Zasmidium cellare ATCC 36951]KAF2164026.1 hypothetical protein M409DRAFT_57122 [Zasmidium cellare ATCC 36951]
MPTFWSNVKFLSIAGVGLFADGYLNISIGLVVPMIGYVYYQDDKGTVPTVSSDVIKGGLSIGMIIGQLMFGLFGDALGRHKIYGKELILTIFGTLMLIVMPPKLDHSGVVAWMTVFRIITGMGTGGDYPMTSSISAETDRFGSRAKLVLTVFSFIGLGSFSSGIVYIILLAAFKGSIYDAQWHIQWVWRLLFGIGLVPCIATLYARLTMKESKPYEKYVSKDTGLVGKDKRGLKEQFADFRVYFSNWRHARTLFAVSFCWFLFDIAFYGINLNQSLILTQIGYGKGKTPFLTLWHTAIGNIIVSCAGYLPGFYVAIFLPDIIGRVRQQFYSSIVVCILYAIWAGVTNHVSTGGLIAIFTISQFVLNLGPNATTFLIPVEVFPTRVRGTAHGIAAASGKAGAVLTAFAFGTITEKIGLSGVLGLFSGIMALCAAVTLLIPETKDKSIEEIEAGVVFGEAPESQGSSEMDVSSAEAVKITGDGKV